MLILSFSSSNCIVLAAYLFQVNGHSPSPWELKGVAIAAFTLVIILLGVNTRFAYRFSNAIGVVKLITLIFIAITGLVVLGGHTRVKDPRQNFREPFAGTSNQPYGLTTSLVYIYFSYGGYNNAFNVVNEVKVSSFVVLESHHSINVLLQNPIRAIKIYSAASLSIVYVLYLLANVAYIAAVPLAELKTSRQTAASLFFIKVFGSSGSVKGLNFLVALSAFGNLLAGNIGISRITRECGRQGVLPYPRFWASTRPFGTPLGPYLIKYILTVLMILAPPAGDAFNFSMSRLHESL
jgi:amino acid transporter